MSHLGFLLEKIKGDGDGDHPNNDSQVFLAARVTVTLRLPSNCSTHGGTTMNSEEKPWRWEKQKEERKSYRFLEGNNNDGRCRSLISLLFLSILDLVTARTSGIGRGASLGFGGRLL